MMISHAKIHGQIIMSEEESEGKIRAWKSFKKDDFQALFLFG
jgi:hypothetical protein